MVGSTGCFDLYWDDVDFLGGVGTPACWGDDGTEGTFSLVVNSSLKGTFDGDGMAL